jgi:hypothetical protein
MCFARKKFRPITKQANGMNYPLKGVNVSRLQLKKYKKEVSSVIKKRFPQKKVSNRNIIKFIKNCA